MILLGAVGCVLDGFTTWVALHGGRFREQTPATEALIGGAGLTAGIVISIMLRVAALALAVVAAERFPRIAKPLTLLAAFGVALAWLVVLVNVAMLATFG